jgi:hypothetical protein
VHGDGVDDDGVDDDGVDDDGVDDDDGDDGGVDDDGDVICGTVSNGRQGRKAKGGGWWTDESWR